MAVHRAALTLAACCILAATAAGCIGGGASENGRPDLGNVPTATLPAELPEVRILSGSAVQVTGSTYTVKSGDTLAGIAEQLGVSLEDLRAANPGIDAAALSVGQSIRLPSDTEAPPAATPEPAVTEAPAAPTEPPPTDTPAPPADTPTPSSLGTTYTVAAGDIPETIAAQFGITVQALLAANPGIDPTRLSIGQVLVIPGAAQP